MTDKRRTHRIPLDLTVQFKSANNPSQLNLARTMDISAVGLCILSKVKFAIGERVTLQVRLPHGPQVELYAGVVWIQDITAYDTHEYRVGLKIVAQNTADEKKYIRFYTAQLREHEQEDKL